MPLQETSGAASYDAFGGGAAAIPNYIEEVFSTWLYTGNSSTQTITNGIDLSGKGGLVWIKSRSAGGYNNTLYDTARGATNRIVSNDADVQNTSAISLTSFSSTGFSLGSFILSNESAQTYVSWTFREQPKFFDIVTYTGNNVTGRTIAHNLGSVPGCIIVKRTESSGDWAVYHRGVNGGTNPQDYKMILNLTNAQGLDNWWNNTPPTSSSFQVSSDPTVNAGGATYVAYLFAHNAGGFGLTGLDNVISCGSFTTDADGFATVNLGYEPQLVMIKRTDSTGNWIIFDNMRGWSTDQAQLNPNSSGAEGVGGPLQIIQSTGFATKAFSFSGNSSNIYIAIRRGPMKVPTSGTEVFKPTVLTNTASKTTTNFPVDLSIQSARNTDPGSLVVDRLRSTGGLVTFDANSENGYWGPITGAKFDDNTGVTVDFPVGASSYVNWSFRRAPGFFDEVCYTGTGVARTVAHNLAAVPELMIVKRRNAANNWAVYAAPLGNTNRVFINQTQASAADSTLWNNTTPTSSVFTVGTAFATNNSADTYVSYLFATVAGVSKVGSYTGTGTTQVINCGFTAGARFVLIKRTDSTGDWYVWDSARGIIAGNDPYLLLNSTAAEVTSTDYVDTASTGFEISSTAPAAINANGGSFIFFAVA